MAKTKLNLNDKVEKLLEQDGTKDINQAELSSPAPSVFENLSKQRHAQRKFLFWFAIFWSSVSLLFLFVVIGLNSYFKALKGNGFSLFSQYELEVLSVAVFGQLIGIVAIIAKSLWDESPFSEMLKKDYEEHHKEK